MHVGRPNIGDQQRLFERIQDILDRRWLSNNGVYVQEFERRIAELTGAQHCIALCNATVALQIAIQALELTGEVILPSFTFVAAAHALEWQGIKPVFCDVDDQTHQIDPVQCAQLITPRTSGILGVHLWGQACPIEQLTNLAAQYRLKLIFDAAHAFACTYRQRWIGNFGDLEVFSFHATKFVNTFEGGAIVTHNSQLARKIRLIKNFGFSGYDQVDMLGINGKMSEVSAAMGITSLESMPDFIEANYQNYCVYQKQLQALPGIRFLAYDRTESSNYQYIVLEVDPSRIKITRDQLVKILIAENVIARRYFSPGCHRMQPYATQYPDAHLRLPVTEQLAQTVMTLPNGTSVSAENVQEISQIIQFAIEHGETLSQRMTWAQ